MPSPDPLSSRRRDYQLFFYMLHARYSYGNTVSSWSSAGSTPPWKWAALVLLRVRSRRSSHRTHACHPAEPSASMLHPYAARVFSFTAMRGLSVINWTQSLPGWGGFLLLLFRATCSWSLWLCRLRRYLFCCVGLTFQRKSGRCKVMYMRNPQG